MKSENIDVEGEASGYGQSLETETKNKDSKQNQFKSAVLKWNSYSIGAQPEVRNNALKWSTQSFSHPMPIKVTLLSMSELLKKY